MRTSSVIRYLTFAMFLLAVSAVTFSTPAYAQIGIYVSFGPPPIPIYDQPICPDDGYIWVPGYWAWDGFEYYWVPGTWVLPPEVGFLWTPGYWEWGMNGYFFHRGYWGPRVGWYGGINYGFGYFGRGYEGGRWDGRRFFYNRAVNHIDSDRFHNVYEDRNFYNNRSRVSYNGGRDGIGERPSADELAFSREKHFGPVREQRQQRDAARADKDLRASVNQGKPPIAATQRPGGFNDHPVGAREPGGRWEPPARGETPSNRTLHPNDLPPLDRPWAPYTGNAKQDQKNQQQQDKLYNRQVQDRQKLQLRQQTEEQNLTRQNANAARVQQFQQRHQQQTQQQQQRYEQKQQQMEQRQQQYRPRGQQSRH